MKFGMVERWASKRREFSKGFELVRGTRDEDEYINEFAFNNGMTLKKVREWAEMIRKISIPIETEGLYNTCINCDAEYSKKLNMCPQCENERINNEQKQKTKQNAEEKQSQLDLWIQRRKSAIKSIEAFKENGDTENLNKTMLSLDKINKQLEELMN